MVTPRITGIIWRSLLRIYLPIGKILSLDSVTDRSNKLEKSFYECLPAHTAPSGPDETGQVRVGIPKNMDNEERLVMIPPFGPWKTLMSAENQFWRSYQVYQFFD
jgi:hypothetical protein